MASSFESRFATALSVALMAGVAASGYLFIKLKTYEDGASQVMSVGQRHIILGQLLEGRMKAAQELVASAGLSGESNEAFKKRIEAISNDLGELRKGRSDKTLDEAKSLLVWVAEGGFDAHDQLFVQYRNIKTGLFNLYRAAWSNKWMNVARIIGLAVNDLDNISYQSGLKAVNTVNNKIAQMVSLVVSSDMSPQSKLFLFGQLNITKIQIARYSETIESFEKLRSKRAEDLRKAESLVRRFNEVQGKNTSRFTNDTHIEVIKGVVALALFAGFSVFWFGWARRRFGCHVRDVARHIASEMSEWVSRGGGILGQHGFKTPEDPDHEFVGTYQTIDETMRRVNTLRREESVIKRLVAIPLVLVNQNRQAVFWNSALTILSKNRSLEESGPTAYLNLVRFTDLGGQAIDPIGDAIATKSDKRLRGLLSTGETSIPVEIICTLNSTGTTGGAFEYVLLQLNDLRDEFKYSGSEIDQQLGLVYQAIEKVRSGGLPATRAADQSAFTIRPPVVRTLDLLSEFALDLREKASVVSGQTETMGSRMAREAGLKKSVHGRIEQLRAEVSTLRGQLALLKTASDAIRDHFREADGRSELVHKEYLAIRKQGGALQEHLKTNDRLVSVCVEQLDNADRALSKVRDGEKLVRAIVDRSHVLNASNSILGARRELKPSDVIAITENVSQLMSQFEHGFRLVEEASQTIQGALHEVGDRLRENLATGQSLTEGDHAIISSINHSGRLIEAEREDYQELVAKMRQFEDATAHINTQMQVVEKKMLHLAQIGQASIELQTQLERGFEGIRGQVSILSGAPQNSGL